MSEDFFEINDMKDLGRVIFFFVISPVVGNTLENSLVGSEE